MNDNPSRTLSSAPGRLDELIRGLAHAESQLQTFAGAEVDGVIDSEGHHHLLRLAQDTLRQSEARFRALIEYSSDIVATLMWDGTITYHSPALHRLLGYQPEELLGRSVFELVAADDQTAARESFARMLKTPGGRSNDLLRFAHRDGGFRWFEGTSSNLLRDPAVRGIVINYRDVTERVLAEAALRDSELKMGHIVQALPAAIYTCDADGRITAYNRAAVELWGRAPRLGHDKWCGSWKVFKLDGEPMAPEDCPMAATLKKGVAVRGCEIIVERPDGSRRHVVPYPEPIVDSSGALVGAVNMFVDVTESRAAERKQRDQAEFISDVVSSLPATIAVLDEGGSIVAVNDAWRRFARENLAGSTTDFVGESYLDHCVKGAGMNGDASALKAHAGITAVLKGEQPDFTLEYPCHAPGEERWFLMRAKPLGGQRRGVVVAHVDVTERRKMQDEAARREQDFRVLFTRNPMPMWVYDLETLRILAVNDAAVAAYGYSLDEFLGMTLKDVRPQEDVPELLHNLHTGTRRVASDGIRRHRKKDGTIVLVEITADRIFFRGREARLVLINDVTEQHRNRLALQESEERFRQVVESIREVFWAYDLVSKRMIYVSPGFDEVFGRSRDGIYESEWPWARDILPEDRERLLPKIRERGFTAGYDESFRICRPDGETRWIQCKAFPVRNASGEVYRIVGVAEDFTDRKRLEEQVLRNQRMEAIGTLAGGIAHDLNNILAPMLMAAGLLKDKLTSPRDQSIATIIENGAQRGSGIIRQLLTFSRGFEGSRSSVQVRHIIKDMVTLIRETFPRNITVESRAPGSLWLVSADATQLHQVLMNLCVNARDAMPKGGSLILAAENARITAEDEKLNPQAKAGTYVKIAVSDTGEGIPSEIINRIFDPFFTTKEVGKGTGLGLSTVLGIVKNHGGFITVCSEPGRGSSFKVYLPASEALQDPRSEALPAPQAGNGEYVLLVDDEEPIRSAAQQLLEQGNYRVLTASNGEEAVRIIMEHAELPKLVLTDLMMPVMGGSDLIRSIRVFDPSIRIIAMTGLVEPASAEELAALGVREVLVKPFEAGPLLHAVKRVLAEDAESTAAG